MLSMILSWLAVGAIPMLSIGWLRTYMTYEKRIVSLQNKLEEISDPKEASLKYLTASVDIILASFREEPKDWQRDDYYVFNEKRKIWVWMANGSQSLSISTKRGPANGEKELLPLWLRQKIYAHLAEPTLVKQERLAFDIFKNFNEGKDIPDVQAIASSPELLRLPHGG